MGADPNMEPLGVKALGKSKQSAPSNSDRDDESEESSDDGLDDSSGDDEKEFSNSLKSLATTTPKEKKPLAKNSTKGLGKESVKKEKPSKTKDTKKTVKEVDNSQMEVKVLDLKGDSKDSISVVQKKKANLSVQSIKPETKKSSFFVGGESDHDDSGGEENEEEEGDGHQPWQVASGRREGYFSKKTGGGEFVGGRGRGSQGPVRGGAAEDANLHPSWQAKKRAPPAMAQFQGKKTKFGTEGEETVRSNSSTGPFKVAKSQEPVHPSWAAKQSQKSTIQSFQGKKMVFDD